MPKLPLCLLACATIAATPLAAVAQTTAFYNPPKLVTRGTNDTPTAGAGEVELQVLVKKDGSTPTIKVVKSTNPADNVPALEIAKSSKYKPAMRDAVAVDGFYDFKLSFTGVTSSAGAAGAAPAGGPLGAAFDLMRGGKYDQAEAALQTYLQAHPDDTKAYTLLAVSNAFAGNSDAAAAAFDKAGPLDQLQDSYKILAQQSYSKAASTALNNQKFADAAAYAGHLVDLDPKNPDAYNMRGNAEIGLQNDAAAIADLQKAKAIAAAGKPDQKMLDTLNYNLAMAQLDAGQYGEASTTYRDVAQNDTALAGRLDKQAYASIINAAVSLANAGKIDESVSRLESGAAAFPKNGGTLLAEASYIMALDKKPDWEKIRIEAEKALALDPNAGRADYMLGIRSSQKQDPKSALDYMNKAKGTTAYSTDPSLAKLVDDALSKLNPSAK